MATPIYLTGFEHGVTPTTNGGGLAAFVQNVTVVSTEHNSGNYSLKATPSGASAYMRWAITGTPGELCGRFYFKIETESASDTYIFDITTTTGLTSTLPRVYINVANNTIELRVGSTLIATSGNTYTVGQWSYVDFYFDINQNPWTLKGKLDGGTEFSGTSATAADTFVNLRIGPAAGSSTLVIYYDDVVLSATLTDYPIGPGGTQLLVPSGSASSNVGTNTMEEQDGTDCGASSYLALASVPMGNATAYIRQATAGTGNYLGVSLGDITDTHSAILGAAGLLAYTAATTTTDKGACIISKDAFSTFTEIWGNPTTRADYSDGSTANVYWKMAIISGVVDDTTVNALEARVGYSDDISPNPYWIDVAVEVAYGTGTGSDITNLDLVTISETINALTVLENEIVPLDLVSYTRTVNDITFVENSFTDLDLISYSSTFNALTILENEIIPLDLVSYSSTFNALTILENEIIPLDLVSYSSTFDTLTVFENIVVPLDLVSYSNTFNALTILENVVVPLDLVSYSSIFNALTVLENEIVLLDLVSYTSTINDASMYGVETIPLDLVSYSSTINDLTILEHEIVNLDLVIYSIVINPLTIADSETISLDLVSYDSYINDVIVLSTDGAILLDLVTFEVTINSVSLFSQNGSLERTISVLEEARVFDVSEEFRVLYCLNESRTLIINGESRIISIY